MEPLGFAEPTSEPVVSDVTMSSAKHKKVTADTSDEARAFTRLSDSQPAGGSDTIDWSTVAL
jgi:hypothetical protein